MVVDVTMELIVDGRDVGNNGRGMEPILLTIFTLFKVFLICKVLPTATGDKDTEVDTGEGC